MWLGGVKYPDGNWSWINGSKMQVTLWGQNVPNDQSGVENKLSMYHSQQLGELYDLENDPWEFDDLWDSPQHRELRDEMIRASFDAHVLLTTDVGSRRIAPM